MQNKYLRWLTYAGVSVLIAPVIVFNAGMLLVGEYEGETGFMGFLGDIYGAALTGELSAWLILLGPVLLGVIWIAVFWAWRKLPQGPYSQAQ